MIIEGLGTRSFFNPGFVDLGALSRVGMLASVQLPWTLSLVASHAMSSYLIPLTITAGIFSGKLPIISRRVFSVSVCLLSSLLILGIFADLKVSSGYFPHMISLIVLILLLFLCARYVHIPEPKRSSWHASAFFLIGLFFAPLNWLSSFFLAENDIAVILFAQTMFYGFYTYFLWAQWFNPKIMDRKKLMFVLGYLIPHAFALIFVGRNDTQYLIVGTITLVSIFFLYRVRKI
jgi:hypothetical protein